MNRFICIKRIYDKNKCIVGYGLQSCNNGKYVEVASENLKRSIRSKEVIIENLTLTSDNRLVLKGNISNRQSINISTSREIDVSNMLNTRYAPKNSREQRENEYLIRKASNSRYGNSIKLALELGMQYS